MSYTIKPVSFRAYQNYEKMKLKERILMGAPDNMLEAEARYQARKNAVQKATATLQKGAIATVGADIFINGTAKGTELAGKAAGTATRAGMWAGAFAVLNGYDAAARKLTDNTDSIKEAAKEHPLATAILYITGGVAALTGSEYLFNQAKNQFAKNYPKQVAVMQSTMNDMKSALNKSWINKEIIEPVSVLSQKAAKTMPTVAKATKTVAPYVPLGIFTYAFVKGMGAKNDIDKDAQQKYKELKTVQEGALLRASLDKIKELDKKTAALYHSVNNYKKTRIDKNDNYENWDIDS